MANETFDRVMGINESYKRVLELWLLAKDKDKEGNPSRFIYQQITGQIPDFDTEPQNAIELCEVVSEKMGFEKLSEQNKVDISTFAALLLKDKEKIINRTVFKAYLKKTINWIAYAFGIVSIIIGGISWWIIGFIIGTFWANGAANLAAQKQRTEPGPKWEMPAHIFIHLIAVLGLIGFSIYNLLN